LSTAASIDRLGLQKGLSGSGLGIRGRFCCFERKEAAAGRCILQANDAIIMQIAIPRGRSKNLGAERDLSLTNRGKYLRRPRRALA
jgi:hypothetical protein